MVGLGRLGKYGSIAYSSSADGSVIVGRSGFGYYGEAFRWENGEMVGLGDLPGDLFESRAYDVSADGSVIVGRGNLALRFEAFIWDEDNGMRSLTDVLENDYGLDLSGWRLIAATGISADGLTIVGEGYNPAGDAEGWIATIPEPSTLLLLGLGILALRQKR